MKRAKRDWGECRVCKIAFTGTGTFKYNRKGRVCRGEEQCAARKAAARKERADLMRRAREAKARMTSELVNYLASETEEGRA